jgi:integrase/recombinase XerD
LPKAARSLVDAVAIALSNSPFSVAVRTVSKTATQYIATKSYPLRNRVMLLTGFWSGMRVGEIASLSVSDVVNTDGTIKAEVRLTADQTKGRQPRTVFLPQKLRDELQGYVDLRKSTNLAHPLFITAGRRAFTANVMTQHFY